MPIATALNKQSRGDGFPVQRLELVLPTCPFPQDPTACSIRPSPHPPFRVSVETVLTGFTDKLTE